MSFTSDPAFMNVIQNRLQAMNNDMIAAHLSSLSPAEKKRVNALKNIQVKHNELMRQFHKEVLSLEKRYLELYSPLYTKRSDIVNGRYQPTEEESKPPATDDEDAEAEEEEKVEESAQEDENATPVSGISHFWLRVLKAHPHISDMITEKDEEALKSLTDIKIGYLDDNPGFKLDFFFSPNDFFSNDILSKTYYLSEPSAESHSDDYMYDRAEGTTIEWKEGKNLAVKVETKKQRHKETNQTRVVKKTIQSDTFFNFFNPPKVPKDDEDITEEEAADLDERLEADYEIGEDIKEKLIPNAVGWFTGEAVEFDMDD